jgi:HD-GYP domain-containing protein (c-di-GMP phosphodiesterase class II)
MKTHVLHGYEIIKDNDFLKDAIDIVLYHHEKVDGTGYMKGLKEEEIPINAKIFAVADVFDALTSKRPYKKPFSYKESMRLIKEQTGSHFSPSIVEVFEKISEKMYNEMFCPLKGQNMPRR